MKLKRCICGVKAKIHNKGPALNPYIAYCPVCRDWVFGETRKVAKIKWNRIVTMSSVIRKAGE